MSDDQANEEAPALVVTFARVGRARPAPLTIPAGPVDSIAPAVEAYVSQFLLSSEAYITADLDGGTWIGEGSIDWGRFGTFTIAPAGVTS